MAGPVRESPRTAPLRARAEKPISRETALRREAGRPVRGHPRAALCVSLTAAAFVALLTPQPALAQSRQTYVQFDPFTVKAVLYRPDSGDRPEVGVLLIHRVNNYLGHRCSSAKAKWRSPSCPLSSKLRRHAGTDRTGARSCSHGNELIEPLVLLETRNRQPTRRSGDSVRQR